jgi:glycosyltransferase involved in cell wall biosynthesis
VFVGQIMRSRLDGLFGALDRIPRTRGVQALIVGDGPDRSAYEHRVASSPSLHGRVFFLGYQERARALGLAAACTLAFSDCWSTAGFPTKLFEYMALGRAIVVQGKEQIGEVLHDGRDALLYRTIDELAAAITRLCEDASLRHTLGAAARASWETRHTWRHRRAQLDALIARHLAARSAQRGPAG